MRKPSLLLSCGALVVGLGAFASGTSLPSCASNVDVDVALLDPENLKQGAKWAQVVVFPTDCPVPETLANGNIDGSIKRFTSTVDGNFPPVGEIPKAKYGFAALLRNENCAVVGFGCTPVDLEVHRHITIQLAGVVPPLGACDTANGVVCDYGTCKTSQPDSGTPPESGVEGGGGSDGEGGTPAQCTLTLVTGGGADLPATAVGNGFVDGPTAVATPSGFLSIYREADSNIASAVRVLVDDKGALKTPIRESATACKGDPSSNGVAAAWNDLATQGFMVIAMPTCGDGGAESMKPWFRSFDKDGVGVGNVYSPLLARELRLMNINGAVPAPNELTFWLASVERDGNFHPKLFTVTTALEVTEQTPPITDQASFTRLAASTGVTAIAYDNPSDGGLGPVKFLVSVPNGNLTPLTYAAAKTAAVGAIGDTALLVLPTASGIDWVVRKPTGASDEGKGSLSISGVTGVDMVAINNHFIVIAAQSHGFSFFRFDYDGDKVTAPSSPIVVGSVGTASLNNFGGTMFSAAAARNRVFLTWLNKAGPLGEASAPGGFAVFQCDG